MLKQAAFFKPVTVFKNGGLYHLHQKINAQALLTQRVKAILPEALAKQVRHCILKDNSLVLYTDSAIWASQLRFYGQTILGIFTPAEAISVLQTKVITSPNQPTTNIHKINIPSLEKIEFLKAYGKQSQNEQLKNAFLKLADTLARLSEHQ